MWNVIMKRMKEILSKTNIFESKGRTMLGRWKITYDPKMIQSKIDWANVDHCGCCNGFK